jgi:hypothetical protein
LLFCLTDFTEVIESSAGPLLTIYYQATRSMAGATCLLMFNVLCEWRQVTGYRSASRSLTCMGRRHHSHGIRHSGSHDHRFPYDHGRGP